MKDERLIFEMRQLTLTDDLILTPRVESHEESDGLMKRLRERGIIIGTDEAGRGALAGPVVAAAVYLTPEQEHELLSMKLRDSKLMTPSGRERLFTAMNEMGVMWRAYMGSVERIERDNVLWASLWTMKMCVERLSHALENEPVCVIVDGNERIPDMKYPQWVLIQADKFIPSVSAASVIAKVLRDRLMMKLDAKYPGYNFKKNKGYPTMQHMETIRDIGITEIHRESFCRKILNDRRSKIKYAAD